MRSPSELPLLRILHIKTLSAALSMLHGINYGTLSTCGSNGMGYCILKEKMATTTRRWMGPCLEETPGYVVLSQGDVGDRQCGDESWLSKATHTCCTPTQQPPHPTGVQVGREELEVQAGKGGSGLRSCRIQLSELFRSTPLPRPSRGKRCRPHAATRTRTSS